MAGILAVLLIVLFFLGSVAITIHGIILCFRKSWVAGLASLVVPIFAQVVSLAQLCGKDLLK